MDFISIFYIRRFSPKSIIFILLRMENEYLNAISDELREIVEAFNELPTITDDSIKNGLLGLVKDLAEIDMRVSV